MTTGRNPAFPRVSPCRITDQIALTGELPPWSHIETCPVCLLRQRVAEARLLGWQPMPAAEAEALFDDMAEEFPRRHPTRDSERYRGFYAALSRDSELKAVFAQLLTVGLGEIPPPRPGFLDRVLRAVAEAAGEPVDITLHFPRALAAAGERPIPLEGTPAGLRAELRWRGTKEQSSLELALVVTDWASLGLDPARPVRFSFDVLGEPPPGVPWADWVLATGQPPTQVMQPTALAFTVPITVAGPALTPEQVRLIEAWFGNQFRFHSPVSEPGTSP